MVGSFIALGLALGFTLVSTLVAYRRSQDAIANINEADNLTLCDINMSQQTEGVVIPVTYGSNWLCGNTIWWYADDINQEQYRYCMWQTICAGGVYLHGRWLMCSVDEKLVSDINILKMTCHAGRGANTGPPASYLNYFPDTDDPPNGAYATRLQGIAHAFIEFNNNENIPGFMKPGRTTIPKWKYFVMRRLDPLFLAADNKHFRWDYINGYIGNNPADIIYDLLTNEQFCLGIDSSEIDAVNFTIAAQYFRDKKYYLNFIINSSTSARNIISKIQQWVECYLIKDQYNRYTIKYFQENDADNPVATIVDNDMVEFVLRRKSWDETFNSFTANYIPKYYPEDATDWEDLEWGSGEVRTLTLKNEANIRLTGSVRHKVVDLTAFGHKSPASERLHQIMKKESYPFATGSLTLNLSFSYIQIGDVITIDSDEYGFIGPFRIVDVNVNEVDNNKMDYELLQMRELVADSNWNSSSDSNGVRGSATVPPCLYNVTFPPNSAVSNVIPRDMINDANSVVAWGACQMFKGILTYGTDYTIDNHNRVHLDEVLFADIIMSNTLGLLNVDVFEEGCPSPPVES